MQSVTSFLCSLVKPFVTTSGRMVIERPPPGGAMKVSKKSMPAIKEKGIVGNFLWDLLNCASLEPPAHGDYCIDNDDCNTGEKCKEGTCLVDPSDCNNSGCEEHHDCNVETGECEFVPECSSHLDCDQINAGELCLNRVCEIPDVCVALTPTIGCANGWSCIENKCVKIDCSTVNNDNKLVCCTTPLAFQENEVECCSYNPGFPGC